VGRDVVIAVHVNGVDADAYSDGVERAVRHTLLEEGVADAEVSVTFLGDEAIRRLNADYLSHDWPTDVLSFALHGPGEPVLADLYIGVDRGRAQARDRAIPALQEMVRLAVHGTLHAVGYEHPDSELERERSEFFAKQERVVALVMNDLSLERD